MRPTVSTSDERWVVVLLAAVRVTDVWCDPGPLPISDLELLDRRRLSFGDVLVAILAVFMVATSGLWTRERRAVGAFARRKGPRAIEPLGVSQSPDE